MRRALLLLSLFLAPLAHGTSNAVCSATPPAGQAVVSCGGGGGVTSPVTVDPLTFSGVVTFNNAANTPVTFSDGSTGTTFVGTTSVCGGAAADTATSVCLSANTFTAEGATGNAFETIFAFGDATADATLTFTATSAGVGATGFGNVTVGNNSAAGPGIILDSSGTDYQIQGGSSSSLRILNSGGTTWQPISGGGFKSTAAGQHSWAADTTGDGAQVAGWEFTAAGVSAPTDGSTGVGWVFEQGSSAALNADYTNATAVMSNISGLTRTLLTGRKYVFDMYLRFSNSTAADGIVIDFDGGTATATDFRVHCLVFDTALLLSAQTTAIATDISATTATGASTFDCHGSFTVNAAGTFIPRAQEEADGGGTLTIELGSDLRLHDVPFN